MDIFQRPGPQPALLLNLDPLSQKEANHLAKVFGVLIGGVGVTLLGVAVNYHAEIGGMFSLLLALFCLSRVFESRHLWKQKLYFTSFEFLKGVSIGSIVPSMLQPILLAIQVAGVLAIVISFTIASVFTRRRQYLFAFAILGSGLIYVALISFLTVYEELSWAYDITTFAGLAGFVIYLLLASQCTLERYQKKGIRTQYQHAADIYVDFVGVIVRIGMICVRKRRVRRLSRKLSSDNYAKEFGDATAWIGDDASPTTSIDSTRDNQSPSSETESR